jgi:hypothetical protein
MGHGCTFGIVESYALLMFHLDGADIHDLYQNECTIKKTHPEHLSDIVDI